MSLLECGVYPKCGGCQLLHLPLDDYLHSKQTLIQKAFKQYGLDIPLPPIISLKPGIRRRVTFKLRGGAVGFYQTQTHTLVPLTTCPVIRPDISNLIPVLRGLSKWFPKGADIDITHSDTGFDINCRVKVIASFSLEEIESLTRFIQDKGWARFSINGIVFLQNTQPQVVIDEVPVHLEPGAFLQASRDMDATLKDMMLKSIPAFKRALDLFCGRGTLSLPLSRLGPVDAYEWDTKAVMNLQKAALAYHRPLRVYKRDLFKDPVDNLNAYDWVIMNPPRAGALKQTKALAFCQAKIFYVSCCPETLARDCHELIKAGRTLHRITAIDAFFGSYHTETIAEIY